MEKTAVRYFFGFGYGLLIHVRSALFLCLAVCCMFSASADTEVDFTGIFASPVESQLFVDSTAEFVLDIPFTAPSEIFVNLPILPDTITFTGSHKESYVSNGPEAVIGTRYRFWLLIHAEGMLEIPPIRISYKGKDFFVPVKSVQVYRNPRLIQPELKVFFEDQIVPDENNTVHVSSGCTINYTVALLHAQRIISYSWELPENSLFTEIERSPFADGAQVLDGFSTEAQPLSGFSWMPLSEGEYRFPSCTVSAISYGGKRVTISIPELYLAVGAPLNKSLQETEENFFFESAFDEIGFSAEATEAESAFSQEQILHVVELRCEERNSLPFSKAQKNRVLYEEEIGLYNKDSEPSYPLYITLLALSCVFLILFVMCFALRRLKRYVKFLFCCLAICSLACLYEGKRLYSKNAILLSDKIFSVPEHSAAHVQTVQIGKRVGIEKQAGDWFFIVSQDIQGWVPSSAVVVLNTCREEML